MTFNPGVTGNGGTAPPNGRGAAGGGGGRKHRHDDEEQGKLFVGGLRYENDLLIRLLQ